MEQHVKIISTLTRAWLGSLFLYSAALKFTNYRDAWRSVRQYGVLPKRLSDATGLALPWAELVAGVSFLFGWMYPLGSVLGAVLGGSFAFAGRQVIKQEAKVSCGCTGGVADTDVDQTTVNRGLAIAAGSLLVLATGRRSHTRLPALSLLAGAVIAIFPSLLVVTINRRDAQRQAELEQQQAIERQRRIAELKHLLAAPAAQALEPVLKNGHAVAENVEFLVS
ncbi:MAG TPA: MauE/DoxX family redox-associated membrane protein [Herpetosiphonaceae bacterium]